MADKISIKPVSGYNLTANDKIKETADETGIIYDNVMSIKDKNDGSGTIWCDQDRNGYYDTQVIIDKSGKSQTIKLNEKRNSVKKVQTEVFNKFSKKADAYYKSQIHIDGKIDNFSQGRTGDCWLLSGLDAINRVNSNVIKKSISQDIEGNVIVSFKGTKQKYKVTPQEIYDSKGRLSEGDDDVRAIELATEKYRAKLAKKGEFVPYVRDKEKIDPKSPTNLGTGGETYMLLTGDKGGCVNKEMRETFLNMMQKNPKSFAAIAHFKEKKDGVITHHGYSIKSVDDEYVTIINPWDSKKEIKIKKKDFLNNVDELAAIEGEKVN